MKTLTPALSACLVACLCAQFYFVGLYLAQEHTLAYWDHAMYANMAIHWFQAPTFKILWATFQQSFSNNYNLLYALPSYLTFWLFEPSRLVFIKTNTFFFFFVQQLGLGIVLARCFNVPRLFGMVASVFLTLLFPFFWAPLLCGYPDHAGGAALVFALYFMIEPYGKGSDALCAGLFLALSILLRRHFAYSAIALLMSCGLRDLWLYKKTTVIARLPLLRTHLIYYSLVAFSSLGLLALIEPSYLQEMLHTDFSTLYKAYNQGASGFLHYLLSRVGLGLFLIISAGYVFGFRLLKEKRQSLIFVLLYTGLWALLWATGPAQTDEHYLLSAFPLFCFVGIGALLFILSSKNISFSVFIIFVLLANSLYALWFAPNKNDTEKTPFLTLQSAPQPPTIRSDMEELVALADYLATASRTGDKIAIVASSQILNQDLIRVVFQERLKKETALQRFIFVPEIDNVQTPALDVFASGTIFVVPEPAQYHLPPSGQKVLGALISLFPPDQALSFFIKKDHRLFHLDGDVTVSVWRKNPLPPALLHKTLTNMREYVNAPIDWVVGKRGYDYRSILSKEGETDLQFRFVGREKDGSLFYDKPLSSGTYRIGMILAAQPVCTNPRLTLKITDGLGHLYYEKSTTSVENPGLLYIPFVVPSTFTESAFLTLDVTATPIGPCSVSLLKLRLEEISSRGLPTTLRND